MREDFIYLGGVISHDSTCEKDVAWRIGLAAGIVRNLGKVWKAKNISKATKSTLVLDLSPVSYFLQLRNLDTEGRTQA